jgi:hypothetical protein
MRLVRFGISLTSVCALVGVSGFAGRIDATATGSSGTKSRLVSSFQNGNGNSNGDNDDPDHDNGRGNDGPTATPTPTEEIPTATPTEEVPTPAPTATAVPPTEVVEPEPVLLDDDPTKIVSSFDGSGNGTVAVDLDGDGVAEFTIVIGDDAGFR